MKCPYTDIQCEYVDTAGMDKPVECQDCPRSPAHTPEKLIKSFTLDELLNMLPKTVIRNKKNIFYKKDIFELVIDKDDNLVWRIRYENEWGSILFVTVDSLIKRAVAKMLHMLISDKFIKL